MNKKQKIAEQLKMIDRRLAAAKKYIAKNMNVRSTSWLHLGDWKGNSGHPLWMKNRMIPVTEQAQISKERALEEIDKRSKRKMLKRRKQ